MATNVKPIDDAMSTILVVDDQSKNIEILAHILDLEGFHVVTASSGEAALQVANETTLHLILLDIMMPGVTGFDVCTRLKADPATAAIPIIFISALNELKDRIKAFAIGGVDYIAKPFNISEVVARVRAHITLRQNQLEIARLRQQDVERIAQMQQEIGRRQAIEKALQQAVQRLTMLNNLLASTSTTLSSERIMQIISEDLHEAFNTDQTITMLVDPEAKIGTLASILPQTSTSRSEDKISLADNALYQRLVQYPVPHQIVDRHDDHLARGFPDNFFDTNTRSLLATPLHGHGQIIGMVFICYNNLHEFTNKEILLMSEVSQMASQSLENSLLHQQLEHHNQQLNAMVAERTAQLNRLNRRMVSILASMTDAIALTHPDGTIDMTNPAFNTTLGYYPDELFGQSIQRVITTEYQSIVETAFDAARYGNSQNHIQIEAVRKDGTTLNVDMSFSTVRDEENHILCNFHDITYLKEMEHIKDNFISMVTHELRTPIANIMLTSHQLKKYLDRITREQLVRKIDQLDMQSHVLAELVESVLDISRLEAQDAKPRGNSVDMLEVVQGVIAELEHAAREKQHSLRLVTDEVSGAMRGDIVDFARIWRNLINNAIKYTPNQGEITIMLGIIEIEADSPLVTSPALTPFSYLDHHDLNAGRYCVGQVQDNGHGIDEKDQENIFKRFHRGWAKQSSIPGTGLGLALVKELLAMYGGDIHVDSALDKGTTFTFWIPFVENVPPLPESSQSKSV